MVEKVKSRFGGYTPLVIEFDPYMMKRVNSFER